MADMTFPDDAILVLLDTAPDGDIGPVVPPPSAPRRGARGVRLPQAR